MKIENIIIILAGMGTLLAAYAIHEGSKRRDQS